MQVLNATAAVTRALEEKIGWNRIAFTISLLVAAVVCALFRPLRDIGVNKLIGAVQATSSVGRS